MLVGTADPEDLARSAAAMSGFASSPLKLHGVETLHLFSEIEREGADALLPPGLHPIVPPAVTWLVQRVADSPWGEFRIAQCRIECRSGLRPRGFVRGGIIDCAEAAAALADRWGYALRPGEIRLERGYDRIGAAVRADGDEILRLELRGPMPLGAADVGYVASVHLAHTPRGLRLVQVDPDYEIERAERGRPVIDRFVPSAWHADGVRPSYPVSASFTIAAVTLPALRYVCRPDVLAFEGTERVG